MTIKDIITEMLLDVLNESRLSTKTISTSQAERIFKYFHWQQTYPSLHL